MILSHAIALAALALAAEQPPPLPATGKWKVDFGAKICTAEHDFGLADQPTVLALRPSPLAQGTDIRLSQVDPGYVSRTDPGTVTLLPSGRTVPAKMTSFGR